MRFGRFAEATVVTSYFLHFILWNNLCSKSSPYRNASKVKGGVSCPVLKHWKSKHMYKEKALWNHHLLAIYIYINIFVLNQWFHLHLVNVQNPWSNNPTKKLHLHHPTVDGSNPVNQLIGILSRYLQGLSCLIYLRWCRISSINSITS